MSQQEKYLRAIYKVLLRIAEKQGVDLAELDDPEAKKATPEKPEAEQLQAAEEQRKLALKRARQDAEDRQ